MKFEVIHDKGTGFCTWILLTNAGEVITSSSVQYCSAKDVEAAIKEFKTWVSQAHTEVITREPMKDWKKQAKEQLKKIPWQKGESCSIHSI